MNKIIKVENIFNTSYLRLYSCSFSGSKDEEKRCDFVSKRKSPLCDNNEEKADYISIMPILASNTNELSIVMIREYKAVINGYELGCPTGSINDNETIDLAVKRILLETTGLQLTEILLQSPILYPLSDLTDCSIMAVLATCVGQITNQTDGKENEIEVLTVEAKELSKILDDPKHRIRHNKINLTAYLMWLFLNVHLFFLEEAKRFNNQNMT